MFRNLRLLLVLPALACSVTAIAQQTTPSADEVWKDLAAGNQRYVSGQPASKDLVAQRKALTKTQAPRVAVLSCSDSRVSPELAFDKGIGDLFVVRTAGESADPLALGSLEYAVEHLHSTVILVMGHQSCGAVNAACGGGKVESVNLEALIKPIAGSCKRVEANKPETMDLAVRDHVHTVAHDLTANSKILRHEVEEGKLTILEAYYSLDTGEVTRLN